MGDPTDRTQEHLPGRLKYGDVKVKIIGKEKIEKGTGIDGEGETRIFRGFFVESRLVARAGEPEAVEELYLSFRDKGDTPSLYKLIQIKTERLREKAEHGEALVDEEVEEIRNLIAWCPGGDAAREWQAELTGVAEEQILGPEPKKINEADVKKASKDWDILRERDLNSNAGVKKAAEAVEKDNEFVADLYLMCRAHGVDPEAVRISDFLRERLLKENRGDLLQGLIQEEEVRSGRKKRKEVSGEKLLAVNPVEYWEQQLFDGMEDRLNAMRGEFNWTETDPSDPDKLIWSLGKYDEKSAFSKGLKTSLLAFDEYDGYFNGQGAVATFLTKMGRKDYWEGKRRLDKACFAKALGLIEGETNDIYAELTQEKIQESGIDALAGPEAVGLWTTDKNFNDAYDLLFSSYEAVYDQKRDEYYFQPPTLKKQIEAARKQGIPERAIEDAIKASIIFGADMVKNAWAKNRLYITERFVEHYRAAKIVDESGRVYDLFSEGFGLTDSITGKMGGISSRNAVIDYAANTPDRRRLDLAKNPDQRDEIWKSVYWYYGVGLRGIYGVRNDPKEPRTTFNGDPATEFHPEDIVLPGNVEDYLDFNNNLTRDIGELDRDGKPIRTYIHRRALYECLKKVDGQDEEFRSKGAPGKPGFNEKFGSNRTLREEIKEILEYFENKKDPSKSEINVEVNDARMHKLLLKTLSNPYSWGRVFSFSDWETVDRMRRGYTIRRALEYEHKAMGAVNALRTELHLYPDRLPEHLGTTSAVVKAAFEKAKGCRYAWSQLTRQAMPLYDFADMATWKLLAKSMPGQEQIEQAYSEAGQGIGYNTSEDYVRMLLNVKGAYTEKRNNYLRVVNKYVDDLFGPRTYLGQSVLVNSMFIWQETEKRLSTIENGDQESADAASMAFILKERDNRAFTWQRARQVLWQARGFFWNKVGSLAKTGVEDYAAHMEQWRQLDITWEMRGGRLVDETPKLNELNKEDGRIHTIAIQDITDAEMELYFNVIEPGSEDFYRVAEIYKQLNIAKKFPPPKPFELLSETKILVFKSPEHRKEFYMNRTTEVLNLFFGREGSYKITLPKKIYRRDGGKKAGEGELIRQAGEIYEYAFSVERVNAYIEAEKIYIVSILEGKGMIETKESVEKMFRTFQANEQLREIDIERIEKALGGYSEFLGNLQRGRYKAFHWLFHKKLAEIPVISSLSGFPVLGGLIKDFTAGDVLGTALAMSVVVPVLSFVNLAASLKDLQGFTFTQLNKVMGGIPFVGESLAKMAAGPAGWFIWFFETSIIGKLMAAGVNLATSRIFPAAPRAVPPHLYEIEETPFKPKN